MKRNTHTEETIDNEALLIERLKGDSHDAFAELYRRYSSSLYAFALSYVKVRESAEEIVEDAFVWIWTHRHELRQTQTLKPLLFICSKHYIINAWRQTVHSQNYEDYVNWIDRQGEDATTQWLDYNDFLTCLHKELKKLPSTQQKVITLSRLEGISNKDIAQRLQLSEQTVKNQITIGLKTLRTKMQKFYTLTTLFIII
uniref:RNA polymerase sigma factor n=1 Tax=Prevotella sp. TaxID=59823 RepID=UPI00402880A1